MTVIEHCRRMAQFSDQAGGITRTFLSPAMRGCLEYLVQWAQHIGVGARVDDAGNFHALLPGVSDRRLIVGSHIDTVPNAGAFDGVLGVVIGMVLAEAFSNETPPCTLQITGFSEEEGVRFSRPFIGSTAFACGLDEEFLNLKDSGCISVAEAINGFGLSSDRVASPQMKNAAAYLEFHIEQGPVLESLNMPLGVVDAIAGQTRAAVEFTGNANHAGTTPMHLRHDAFCAAAEWTLAVEEMAQRCSGLVATVGSVNVAPGAVNVVPGRASLSLDIRHAQDAVQMEAFDNLLRTGRAIAHKRDVVFESTVRLEQSAVPMDAAMVRLVERAVSASGVQPHRLTSGAGHDAMILAKHVPSAMIFLRSPHGISHHPDETVLEEDVNLALIAGRSFVENFV